MLPTRYLVKAFVEIDHAIAKEIVQHPIPDAARRAYRREIALLMLEDEVLRMGGFEDTAPWAEYRRFVNSLDRADEWEVAEMRLNSVDPSRPQDVQIVKELRGIRVDYAKSASERARERLTKR